MSFEELVKWAKHYNCQLVPNPPRVDHSFKVGDRIREDIPARATKNVSRLTREILTPRTGVVVAYASTEDLIVRADDGRYWIAIARIRFGGARIKKVEADE